MPKVYQDVSSNLKENYNRRMAGEETNPVYQTDTSRGLYYAQTTVVCGCLGKQS